MKNTTTTPAVPVAQVVELCTATTLTLGGGAGGAETRNRPFGSGNFKK